jgi:AraC-like DNA-binding protein
VRDYHREGDLRVHAAGSLGRWNDIVGAAFSQCVVDTKAERFRAELWRGSIGDINLVRIRAPASQVTRWQHGGPGQSSGKVLLHLQADGTSLNRQARRETRADAGEAVLCDADRGYSVDFLTPYEMFVVELPLPVIVGRIPEFDIDGMAGQKVDARRSQLLLAFLQAAWSQRDCLADDPDWRDCVSRTSMDLALRAISQSGHLCSGGSGNSELRRAVMDFIVQNLADPDLRTSAIAQAMGVSARSVQAVFERLATTTSGFILDRRLDAAAKALAQGPNGRSITDLAFDCGFSDSAYFSRCFRHRYGASPREYRRGAAPVRN